MESHERKRAAVSREEWAKRVGRWRDSGLRTAEFAAELGINPRTLTYWKWTLGKEARGEKREWPRRKGQTVSVKASQETAPQTASLIEVHAEPNDARFELELRGGHRLRVPTGFDAQMLSRLLDVLEAR
jgi:hypothetical protein